MLFATNRLGNLKVKNHISRGAEARVWQVVDKFGNEYAVKDYMKHPSKFMENELKMHAKIGRHANISHPVDDAYRLRRKQEIYAKPNAVVYKYYKTGDLADYYDQYSGFTQNHVAKIMKGMWEGLAHCHAQGVCHRDIKPQNLLYDDTHDTVILSDFGMSMPAHDIVSAGTSLYHSAPECFGRKKNDPYDYRCDIWSSGTSYLTMISGSFILEGNHGHNVRRFGHKYLKRKFPNDWDKMSNWSRMILTATLLPNPADRCEASEIARMLA